MLAIGNSLANSVWECQTNNKQKPGPTTSREEKERWIRAKYEAKEFLPPPSNTMPLGQQLIDAVCASNIKQIISVLARANPQEVNTTVAPRDLRTPLHLACAIGNIAVAQLLIWVSLFHYLLYVDPLILRVNCNFLLDHSNQTKSIL